MSVTDLALLLNAASQVIIAIAAIITAVRVRK